MNIISLGLINDIFSVNYTISQLHALIVISIIGGILVITSTNPIISIFFLIMVFACISLYLISIGLTFIGLAYLLVYIGAISILFLFILMLINIRASELQNNSITSIPLAIIILFIFNYIISKIYLNTSISLYFLDIISNDILFGINTGWDESLILFDHITSIGYVMYTSHNIWLIIASLILLLAMIGAIIITIKKGISLMVEQSLYTRKVRSSSLLFLMFFYLSGKVHFW